MPSLGLSNLTLTHPLKLQTTTPLQKEGLADSSVNSTRILELSSIQNKSIATSTINTASILELRESHSKSETEFTTSFELLKKGQKELNLKMEENSASFK